MTFVTICNSYLKLYFFTDTQISYIASAANLFGIFSSGIVSVIIDKNKKYKKILIILSLLSLIGMSSITSIFELVDKKYTQYICSALYIITISFITPIYTTSMDYVIELTYPVGESISEGINCFLPFRLFLTIGIPLIFWISFNGKVIYFKS